MNCNTSTQRKVRDWFPYMLCFTWSHPRDKLNPSVQDGGEAQCTPHRLTLGFSPSDRLILHPHRCACGLQSVSFRLFHHRQGSTFITAGCCLISCLHNIKESCVLACLLFACCAMLTPSPQKAHAQAMMAAAKVSVFFTEHWPRTEPQWNDVVFF